MATSTDLRAAIEEVQLAMPGTAGIDLDIEGYDVKGAVNRLAERIGSMPWWVISTAIHSVLFLLASLFLISSKDDGGGENIRFTVDVSRPKPPEFKISKHTPLDTRTVFTTKPAEPDDIRPVPVKREDFPSEDLQTDDNMDSQMTMGEPAPFSDMALPDKGAETVIGLAAIGPAPGGFVGRPGPGGRRDIARPYDPTGVTVTAVDRALNWLRRHQEAEGHWDASKWGATLDDRRVDVSMTALALLAYMGSGFNETSRGYGETVRRATLWLLKAQEQGSKRCSEPGRFDRCMYTQGIATLALAEAYGMSGNENYRRPVGEAAQAAVDVIVRAQGPYEGWNYTAKKSAGRNDTSVTGWNLMALKSAKLAGLRVDMAALQGCMRWLDAATNARNGHCAYAGSVGGKMRRTDKPSMWAAGMLMRQFMGENHNSKLLRAAAVSIRKHQPAWDPEARGKSDFYYWYYGTLAMFQLGGDYWKEWNGNMKKAFLGSQRTGGPLDGSVRDVDGSWDPVGRGGIAKGGRVFSTALAALSLEVYYRYLPVYRGH